MRRGRIEKAETITKKISQSVVDHAKVIFSPSRRESKELWEKVRQIAHKTKSDSCLNQVTVAQLNQHFAIISTDQHYIPPLSKSMVYKPILSGFLTEYHVFRMLDQVKHTSVGLDNLPHWFLQLAASSFSLPLSHLFNWSLKRSIVPTQWKTSIITPVPKVNPPLIRSDYRPISITPILARLMKKSTQLLYTSPAWWGYPKADERNRLQSTIVKAMRYGYLPHSFSTLDELREHSDDKLFFSARYNPNHVLHRLLPQPKSFEHNLRQRTRNLTLPMDVNTAMKQNFVCRMLFSYIC